MNNYTIILGQRIKQVLATTIFLVTSLYGTFAIGQEKLILLQTNPTPSKYVTNLSNLLMAEIAYTRKHLELTARNYLDVATTTQNIEYAQLATEYALQLQTETIAIQAAELWAKLAPQNFRPALITALLHLQINQDKANKYLTQALIINPTQATKQLLTVYNDLTPATQTNLHLILKNLSLTTQHLDILTLTAEIALAQNDSTSAEQLITSVLNTQPDFTWGIEVKAKIIRHIEQKDEPAINYLTAQIKQYPKNDELRLFYVQALLDTQDFKTAIPQLLTLSKNSTYNEVTNLYLGEIYLIQNNITKAEKYFLKTNDPLAKFYLGNIAENKHDLNAAINYYTQVINSEYHITAFVKAIHIALENNDFVLANTLLQQATPLTIEDQKQIVLLQTEVYLAQNNYNDALELINNALGILPQDIDFLYTRSVISKHMNKPKLSEKDLKLIIKLEPNNTLALNALGFIIADDPKRHHEALGYVKQALQISPENPIFMDSLGWVLYKMGNTTEAVKILQQAHSLNHDPNIAIHLGEVLWVSGQKNEAQKIWQQIAKNTPEYSYLMKTIKRLKAEIN